MYKVKISFINGFAEYYEGFESYHEAQNSAYNLLAENLHRGAINVSVVC